MTGHPVRVLVVDGGGRPVRGAAVEVTHAEPRLAWSATTGLDGTADLELPAGTRLYSVLALKSGLGFDYFENYPAWPPGRSVPEPPREVRLVLNGAREVWVRAEDSSGRPLPGVPLTPWTVRKAGKLGDANCSGCRATQVATDPLGIARFDWLPLDLSDGPQFVVPDRMYHCPRTPWIDLAHPDRLLTARLFRNVLASGRVLFPDGSPAAGMTVQAEGRGGTNHYCRNKALSGPDGRYELLLYPDQSYLVTVTDARWAVCSLRGVITCEGQPLRGLDLRLVPGTRLCGRVTLGPDRRPVSGETVTVIEQGGRLHGRMAEYTFKYEELVRWAYTDEEGRYEIRLGPGRYKLRGPEPPRDQEFLTVGTEEEIVRDFHVPFEAWGPIRGEVRRADSGGVPVAGAYVEGQSVVLGHAWFQAVTDGEGRFAAERWHDATLVYARSPDGNEAGTTEIGEQDESVTIEVSPAAVAQGDVVDQTGAPRSNEHVFCRMRAVLRDGKEVTYQLEARTDLDGRYVIPGLLVGSHCDVTVLRGSDAVARRQAFVVGRPGVDELPAFVMNEAP